MGNAEMKRRRMLDDLGLDSGRAAWDMASDRDAGAAPAVTQEAIEYQAAPTESRALEQFLELISEPVPT